MSQNDLFTFWCDILEGDVAFYKGYNQYILIQHYLAVKRIIFYYSFVKYKIQKIFITLANKFQNAFIQNLA